MGVTPPSLWWRREDLGRGGEKGLSFSGLPHVGFSPSTMGGREEGGGEGRGHTNKEGSLDPCSIMHIKASEEIQSLKCYHSPR
jgi:hypothetical protein